MDLERISRDGTHLYNRVEKLRRYGSRRTKVIVRRYAAKWSARAVLAAARSQVSH
jgi:hypothetical protein